MSKTLEVFEVGTELCLRGGHTGLVEKVIIGANGSVTYQIICYNPERHQQVVNDFEITPVGSQNKTLVGFTPDDMPPKCNVTIHTDTDNILKIISRPAM